MSTMDDTTGAAVGWLLASAEPAVRLLAPAGSPWRGDRARQRGPRRSHDAGAAVGPGPGRGFGVHPYRRWTGAHWRLVSLVELGIPAGEPCAVRAAGTVLGCLPGADRAG